MQCGALFSCDVPIQFSVQRGVMLPCMFFQCNVVMDGEKMTETQKMGDVSIVITREVVGGELVSVSRIKLKIEQQKYL